MCGVCHQELRGPSANNGLGYYEYTGDLESVGNGGEGRERWGTVAKVGNDGECGYEGAMVVKMKLEAGGRVEERVPRTDRER
ncbi:hypothetical protein Tco_0386931 [Tanacetum coccineum]